MAHLTPSMTPRPAESSSGADTGASTLSLSKSTHPTSSHPIQKPVLTLPLPASSASATAPYYSLTPLSYYLLGLASVFHHNPSKPQYNGYTYPDSFSYQLNSQSQSQPHSQSASQIPATLQNQASTLLSSSLSQNKEAIPPQLAAQYSQYSQYSQNPILALSQTQLLQNLLQYLLQGQLQGLLQSQQLQSQQLLPLLQPQSSLLQGPSQTLLLSQLLSQSQLQPMQLQQILGQNSSTIPGQYGQQLPIVGQRMIFHGTQVPASSQSQPTTSEDLFVYFKDLAIFKGKNTRYKYHGKMFIHSKHTKSLKDSLDKPRSGFAQLLEMLDPKPYVCSFEGCEWSFARQSDLRRHTKSHKEPTFHCPYWRTDPTCHRNGGSFSRLDVLKRHLRLVHYVKDKQQIFPGSDPGWCRACQKMFQSSKHFIDHCVDCANQISPAEWRSTTSKNGDEPLEKTE